jgi:hypothetical protein
MIKEANKQRIRFLIAAVYENSAYIDLVYNDSDLSEESKQETILKITNVIINQALELQSLSKND